MSARWTYVSTLDDPVSIIKRIFCDTSKFPAHLKIYPWTVELKSGAQIGLYLAQSTEHVFSDADKAALENALKNASDLRTRDAQTAIEKLEDTSKPCDCCQII